MPAVVHELMHIGAVEDRHGALLHADEIEAERKEEAAEDRPRQNVGDGNGGGAGLGERGAGIESSLDLASIERAARRGRGLTLARDFGRLQWRDRAGFKPSSATHDEELRQ